MKKIIIAVVLCAAVTAPSAWAESSLVWSATELLRGCNLVIKVFNAEKVSEEENNLSFYTNGYLSGYVQAHEIAAGPHASKGDFCIPNNAYLIHQARAIVKYLNDNPKELVKKPSDLVFDAFKDAYPCKKK